VEWMMVVLLCGSVESVPSVTTYRYLLPLKEDKNNLEFNTWQLLDSFALDFSTFRILDQSTKQFGKKLCAGRSFSLKKWFMVYVR
jgi:hypothetical protein